MVSRSRSSVLLVALLSAACGKSTEGEPAPEAPGDDGPIATGGQRLQAVFLESGGMSVLERFYDTELALECDFMSVAPDAYRCLPLGAEAVRPADAVYGDPACNEQLVALYDPDDGCTRYRYAVYPEPCGGTTRVFEIGDPSPVTTRYRLADGACVESSAGTDYLTDLYTATPIPLENFQAARVELGEETGGVVPVDLVSDDGARVRLGFRDALEGFDCELRGEEGDLRCQPAEAGIIGYVFADASCTVPAALQLGCEPNPGAMPFAWSASEDAYHRIGARLEIVYSGGTSNCQPSPDATAFSVGDAVPITRFAAGQRRELSQGALTAAVDVVGTVEWPQRGFRSTALEGYPCHVANGADGELRCMPVPEFFEPTLFADADCTVPVEVSWGGPLVLRDPGVCPEQIRAYEFGPRHMAPVYTVSGGECLFAHDSPPDDSARTPHHAFPSEIAPAEFPLLTRVRR